MKRKSEASRPVCDGSPQLILHWEPHRSHHRTPPEQHHHSARGLVNYRDHFSPFAYSNKPKSQVVQVAHNKDPVVVRASYF